MKKILIILIFLSVSIFSFGQNDFMRTSFKETFTTECAYSIQYDWTEYGEHFDFDTIKKTEFEKCNVTITYNYKTKTLMLNNINETLNNIYVEKNQCTGSTGYVYNFYKHMNDNCFIDNFYMLQVQLFINTDSTGYIRFCHMRN